MSPRTRRLSTLTGAAALTLSTLAVAGAPAQAHPAGDRAVSAGATWLEGQLTDGLAHNDQYGFDDLGLSADIAFALDAVGHDSAAARTVAAIEPKSESWVGGFTPGRVYAGSLAKLVSLVQATGRDATAFNGVDQVARLEGLVSSAAPIDGRLEDAGVDPTDPYDADFVNVIGQSFAARALTATESGRAEDAVDFLLRQQCDTGFFRFGLTADKTSPEQGCAAGDAPHLDTTALAVINILDTPGVSQAARDAAAEAAGWLGTQQATDGSFSAGGTEGVNANSTGLAAWALAEAGDTARATKAATWLRGVQIADLAPCATALTAANGAIAFNANALASSRKSAAITIEQQDQYRRTTAQALPALAHVPAGSGPLAVTAPAKAKESTAVSVTVTGLGAGEPACVTLGSKATPVTGTGGDITVTFELPAGAGTHPVAVTALGGSATTSVAGYVVPSVGDLHARRVVKVRKNRFRLKVSCEAAAPCEGTLKVRTTHRVRTAPGKKARKLVVAKRSYSVAAGDTERVRLKVRKPARRVLARGKVKVRAVATAPGARRTTVKFWLKKKR